MNKAPEPEFEQALNEIRSTLGPLFEKDPSLERAFQVVQIPERTIQFRVLWEDDQGQCRVNNGFRVQFSSTLGPYKGGLRFHPTVNLSILKFLGFEQTFKNALTGLAMGGAKGGADFDPKGKSDREIQRFCEAFMRELSRHIGDLTDVPAGDIGVSPTEIGYMFGAYKRYRNEWAGVLTGKGLDWGGSNIRPEATGYGLVYFVTHMLEKAGHGSFRGKKVMVSGSGNVAQYAALKAIELGATVVSVSDSKGCLLADPTGPGFSRDDVLGIQALKAGRGFLDAAGTSHGWHPGKRPWTLLDRIDIALPCATQNEVSGEEAEHLIKAGCLVVAEGSNMGSTQDAVDAFEDARKRGGVISYAPGKAANCGGVAVSGLEMAQNSSRVQWTSEEVDSRLAAIMKNCFDICYNTGKQFADDGQAPSLVAGANIAGFLKVAKAMKATGEWW